MRQGLTGKAGAAKITRHSNVYYCRSRGGAGSHWNTTCCWPARQPATPPANQPTNHFNYNATAQYSRNSYYSCSKEFRLASLFVFPLLYNYLDNSFQFHKERKGLKYLYNACLLKPQSNSTNFCYTFFESKTTWKLKGLDKIETAPIVRKPSLALTGGTCVMYSNNPFMQRQNLYWSCVKPHFFQKRNAKRKNQSNY